MIKKKLRVECDDRYDIQIIDRNGKSFQMYIAGNLDLYWIPAKRKNNGLFEFDKTNKTEFRIFNKLFDLIKDVDDRFYPVLNGDTIRFISEDRPEEDANILEIKRTDDLITIEFIEGVDHSEFCIMPRYASHICFCNSGSRIPKVESLFMYLFLYLTRDCKSVEIVDSFITNQP
ncbi:MAG: hypothetical protein E7374_01105 [Clostridiales bacterium]|nr:hypothetical protein [Clostridiales bacterium]